ncbi:MAG TPA: gliding motility protein GldC [Bacteroidia bacterium]|jgi:gliding motility-associated protein GldC|nr:gliding motility protein GldC [Bacteroidia bacterium]
MKQTEIKLKVSLDDNNLPINIEWNAPDAGQTSNCKSMMLAMWDEKENNTLRIDLWTKDMSVDEMKKFYIQNIMTLTDTYLKATADEQTSALVKDFFEEVGKKIGVFQ